MPATDRIVPKVCLTLVEAAWSLGVSERKVRGLVEEGELPVVKLGGRVLYDPEDLKALMLKCKKIRPKRRPIGS